MCTTEGVGDVETLAALTTELTSTDVSLLDDRAVRDNLLALVAICHQINAAIWSHTAVFDARGLSVADGFKTTKYWLKAHARLMPAAAAQTVRRARVLRELPALSAACARGEVCADQVARVVTLATDVGVAVVREHDEILAALAARSTASEVEQACARVRAHADPDGPEPKPGKDWAQRDLSVPGAATTSSSRANSTSRPAPRCSPRRTRYCAHRPATTNAPRASVGPTRWPN
jgi:hypothetical protein